MTTTKDKLEFALLMGRHTRATLRQVQALMRYAGTLQRLAEDDCNVATDDAGLTKRNQKRNRVEDRVIDTLLSIPGYNVPSDQCAVFSGDPRGAVLKIRVPSGVTNDLGQEGICVPS
jgi:hypothetical protein